MYSKFGEKKISALSYKYKQAYYNDKADFMFIHLHI